MKTKTLAKQYMQAKLKVASYQVGADTPVDLGVGRDETTEQFLGWAKDSRAAKIASALQGQLQAEVDKLRQKHAHAGILQQQLRAGVRAAAAKYGELVKQEVAAAEKRIAEARADWERNRYDFYGPQSIRMREMEAHVAALSDAEVEQAATSYITDPGLRDPLEIDLLSARLRAAGSDLHPTLRQVAEDNGYRLPWLQAPEIQEAVKTVAKYESLEPGQMIIELEGGGLVAVRIGGLVDLKKPLPEPEIREDFSL